MTDLEAGDGHNGDHRVGKSVPQEPAPVGQPFGPRRTNVRLVEDFQHGRPAEPGDPGRVSGGERDQRHDHVQERLAARAREDAQLHGEQEDQKDSQEEVQQCASVAENGEGHGHAVQHAVAVQRHKNPQQNT